MELQTSQETGWSTTASSSGRKPWAARVVLLLSSVLMTMLALVGVAVTAPSSTGLVSLPQSVAPQVAAAHLVGATTGSQSLSLAISLRSRNQAGLQDYASQVAQPKSKLYHQYLTPTQFASVFGADPAALNSVEHYMQTQGLHLSAAQSGGLFLTFSGTVSQVESAFHTQINNYKAVDGRSVYANATALQVPSALASSIMDVAGTETIRVEHAAGVASPKQPAVSTSHVVTCPTGPTLTASAAAASYNGLLPKQIATAYNMTSTSPGQGVWVAMIENDGFATADLSQYASCTAMGISSSVQTAIAATPGTTYGASSLIQIRYPGLGAAITPGANAQSVEAELETLLGLDQNLLHLTVVETAPTAMGTQLALADIANNNGPQVVGDSWGMCESDLGFPNAQAEEQLFMQMALQGQSAFAATGNSGLYACNGDGNNFRSNGFGVMDPASDPFVTAVGGTQLAVTTNASSVINAWGAEQPWINANLSSSGTYAAAGGGISLFWPAMSWQTNSDASVSTLAGGTALVGALSTYNNGTTPARVVPDVSADADPVNSSVSIYCSVGACTSGITTNSNVGGTNIANAIWVAAAAQAAQAAIPSGSSVGGRLGNVAPALYTTYKNEMGNALAAGEITGVGGTNYCDFAKVINAAYGAGASFGTTCAGTAAADYVLNNAGKTLAGTAITSIFPSSAGYQQLPTTSTNVYGATAGFGVGALAGGFSITGYNALTGLGSPNVGNTTGGAQLAAYLAAQARVAIPRMYMVAQASSDKTLWIGSFAINQYVPNMPTYTQWFQIGTTVFTSAPAVVDDGAFGGTANNLYIFGANPLSPSGVSVIKWNIASATGSTVSVTGALPAATPNNTCTSVSAFTNAETTSGPAVGGYGVYCVTPSGALYGTSFTTGTGTFAAWNSLAASGVNSAPQVASDGTVNGGNKPNYALIFQSGGSSNVQYLYVPTAATVFNSMIGAGGSSISLASASTLLTSCNSTPSLAYLPSQTAFAASCIASDTHNMWANTYRPTLAASKQWSFWQLLGQPSPSVTFAPGSIVAVDQLATDPGYGLVFYVAEGSDKGMYLNVVNPTSTNILGKISGWQSVSLPGIFNGNAGADYANS